MATATIPAFAAYAGGYIPVIVLVALFVTLIPTTIGALVSAIGIAGMDRLVRFNVLAMSGRAVEAAGDVDTLLLDKMAHLMTGSFRECARSFITAARGRPALPCVQASRRWSVPSSAINRSGRGACKNWGPLPCRSSAVRPSLQR